MTRKAMENTVVVANRRNRGSAITLPAFVAAATLAIILTGCVAETPPTTSPSDAAPSSSTPAPVPSDAPPPTLVPGGTAAENKAFFDYLNAQVVTATGNNPDGPAFINSLRTAGFPVESMEVTPDITTVGVKADSVQFAVHASDACLVGQWGTLGGYTSMIAAPLSTGKCFIGQTRAIDF